MNLGVIMPSSPELIEIIRRCLRMELGIGFSLRGLLWRLGRRKSSFYRKIGWLFCFWSSRRYRLCRSLWLRIHNFQIILREYWSICLFQWRPFCLRRPDTPKGNLQGWYYLWKECILQLRDLIRRGEVFRV